MGLLRRLLLFKLGALFGMVVAAAFFKRVVRSRGDAESDELALVAILDGVGLASRAKAFRGGSMLAWFGGIDVDLRDAELASGAALSVHALFGGIDVTTPASWRIESDVKTFMGGAEVGGAKDDPDAQVWRWTAWPSSAASRARPAPSAPAETPRRGPGARRVAASTGCPRPSATARTIAGGCAVATRTRRTGQRRRSSCSST